ncbi:energy-coupling factor transporter transmembrane protein EcfT [Synechococcus sp. RSCCF101]|uniref:energy-coupling factor transporter transmembrane component T n=1 Tax=Synechococcus sp. RSCCF101 TaxID=2511069 RepID=UPI001247F8D5|nr:energy-coupling factor transporter transmembrane component T [Synechococcus sp. RSCCF101]QEY32085.1 energy-coupling factor transporter transmembrane protein EcfT [Synechococcus sp. RSCCF101]
MDWLRQLPIGQFVAGCPCWLRRLDARLKLAWTVAFLMTPVLAGPLWRLGLVLLLLLITAVSGLPWALWRRSLPLLLALCLLVGGLAAFLPAGAGAPIPLQRPPQELHLAPDGPKDQVGPSWIVFEAGPLKLGPLSLGPLTVTRRSARLGFNTATLLLTLIHSANLMLVCTPPEELVWALAWTLTPLRWFRVPVERLAFMLLLALRFLPLVQEEFQNLLRSLATRAVSFRRLGFKPGLGLALAVGERLLANVLLRAEQGADALIARGGHWLAPAQFRPLRGARPLVNGAGWLALVLLLGLRGRYGAL